MILEALTSEDIEERKEAVRDLARAKSREALALLLNVQREDEDPEVRELARRGVAYVRKFVPEDKLDAPVRKTKSATAYAIYDSESSTAVPDKQKDQARDYFNEALARHERGDDRRAADLLGKALLNNPDLISDPYVITTAGAITGIDGSKAIEKLVADQRKPRTQQRSAQGSLWMEALLDVGLYGLVSAGGTFAAFLIVSRFLWPTLEGLFLSDPVLAVDRAVFALLFNNIAAFALFAVASGLSSVVTFMVQNGVVHLVATGLLGGFGHYPVLLSKTAVVAIASYLFGLLVGLVALLMLPDGIIADLAGIVSSSVQYDPLTGGYTVPQGGVQLSGAWLQLLNTLLILCAVGAIGALALLYYYSRAVARTYRFGVMRGFVALIGAQVLIQLLGQYILSPLLGWILSLAFQLA